MDKDGQFDERLRVVVAEDDPLVRRLIRDTLQRDDITVIAEASTGREAVELALFYRPDVVLMDYLMPELDGVAATRELHRRDPDIRVVVVTGAGDDEVGLRALRAGAVGFLTKDVELEALGRTLRGTVAGEAAISRELTMRLLERVRGSAEPGRGMRPVRSGLTNREWEVLDLLAAGTTTEEIAQTLVLSPETVRSHLKNIYRKLDVNSRADAVRVAGRMRDYISLMP